MRKTISLTDYATFHHNFPIYWGDLGSWVREEEEGKEARVGICLCFGDEEREKEDEEIVCDWRMYVL